MRITTFRPADASPAELDEYVEVEMAAAAAEPDGPQLSRPAALAPLTAPRPGQQRYYWIARDEAGQAAGTARLVLIGDQPAGLTAGWIDVRPDHRRRGFGTALLTELAAAAAGRHTILVEGLADGATGQAFAARHGFAVVQRMVELSLDLTGADQGSWQQAAPVPGYRLVQWTGSAPDVLVSAYARARNGISEAPRGDVSFTEPEVTVGQIRAEEATARARDWELRVAVAVPDRSAEVAGLTYLELRSDDREVAIQQDTVVLPAHRGRGLGHWLKAANLARLAADHPQVRQVRTTNAAENEHMLRVNRQIGFTVRRATEIRAALVTGLAAAFADQAG